MTLVKEPNSIPFMTFLYDGAKRVVQNAVPKVTEAGDVILVGWETRRGKERTGQIKAYRADRIGA